MTTSDVFFKRLSRLFKKELTQIYEKLFTQKISYFSKYQIIRIFTNKFSKTIIITMNNLKKSPWHEPEAEEFRRYLKEKNVMQAIQPALSLLYKLPVKPTDLYEFFAEFLDNGARTMVKLSLLRAEYCFIKNEIHVMKNQVKQMKERIMDTEDIVQKFQNGTNPLQDESYLHTFSLIDRFISDVRLNSIPTNAYRPSQLLLQIEHEIDAEDEERRDMEPTLKFIEDHQEIDPLGILFEFRIPEPDDPDLDFKDITPELTEEPIVKKRVDRLRSKSIFQRANTGIDELDIEETFDDENNQLQASALTYGRLVIGMGRLHEKRKTERKLIRKPIGIVDLQQLKSKYSSDSSHSSDEDRLDDYDSASSILNLYKDLQIPSRLKKDKEHRQLLRVLHSKKLKLLSGGKDWLPITTKTCAEKEHDAKHKYKQQNIIKSKNKQRDDKHQAMTKSDFLKSLDKEIVIEKKQKRMTNPRKLKHHRHHHHGYTKIGIDSEIATLEKLHKLFGHKSIADDYEDDEIFLNNFGPNKWTMHEPVGNIHTTTTQKLKTNPEFLFEFPLEQVLEAQEWIDNNFMESIWHLNEPLDLQEDINTFDDDEDDNYIWLENYNECYDFKEINDDNLTVNRKTLDKIHGGIKNEKNIFDKSNIINKGEEGEEEKIIHFKICQENDLSKLEPIASVPSLLKTNTIISQKYPSPNLRVGGYKKRSEKTKQFVNEMFDEQYRKKLLKQFQFDMLDDD